MLKSLATEERVARLLVVRGQRWETYERYLLALTASHTLPSDCEWANFTRPTEHTNTCSQKAFMHSYRSVKLSSWHQSKVVLSSRPNDTWHLSSVCFSTSANSSSKHIHIKSITLAKLRRPQRQINNWTTQRVNHLSNSNKCVLGLLEQIDDNELSGRPI